MIPAPMRVAAAVVLAVELICAPSAFAFGPQGPAFEPFPPDYRDTGRRVARNSSGTSVFVRALNSGELQARRFSASGSALDDVISVGPAMKPDVAIDAAGGFAVSAVGDGGPADPQWRVRVWRYDAGGNPIKRALVVDTVAADLGPDGNGGSPSIAMNDAGNFVVAWTGVVKARQGGGQNAAVLMRRYDAAGVAQGPEIQVSSLNGVVNQRFASVGISAGGDIAVAWNSDAGVLLRYFDSLGTPTGPEMPVSLVGGSAYGAPSLAMAPGGAAVVAWATASPTGLDAEIKVQRFSAAGKPQGNAVKVNQTAVRPDAPVARATIDYFGDFLVVWESIDYTVKAPGSDGVWYRRYSPAGVPFAGETLLYYAQEVSFGQTSGAAMDRAGNFTLTWNRLARFYNGP